MPGNLTIRRGRLVLPDRVVTGDLLIEDGVISQIAPRIERTVGEVVDATGLTVLPGVIDPQVHFRDPGQPEKEDLGSGSRAAAAGGVTAFLDMPNTQPATTSVAALHDKLDRAAERSCVHYGFFMGATGDNLEELKRAERTCGIKIFMGSSTGNLLVSEAADLEAIFSGANKLIAVHAEDERRLQERKVLYSDSHDPADHPKIRDVETALNATRLACELSLKYGRRLHVLHLTSAEEVDFLRTIPRQRITAEVCPQHLFLHAPDAYEQLGTRAQCNPPVRGERHGRALWRALKDGTLNCMATDHAPHTLEEKARPYPTSPSGMPNVEWLLPLMLDQVHRGACTLHEVVRWLCEGPAECYRIPRKGRLEIGFDGDVVLVDPTATRTVEDGKVWTRCGWSPWSGREITGWPVLTAILGNPVFRDGAIVEGVRGRELTFAGTSFATR